MAHPEGVLVLESNRCSEIGVSLPDIGPDIAGAVRLGGGIHFPDTSRLGLPVRTAEKRPGLVD